MFSKTKNLSFNAALVFSIGSLVSVGTSAFASAPTTPPRHVNQDEVPPPLPPQKGPIDQKEYEKSLRLPERNWIHQASNEIDKKLAERKIRFHTLCCFFRINQRGKIMSSTIDFATLPLPRAEMVKIISSLSPLPQLPAHGPTNRGAYLRFDEASAVKIRIE
jgi:hypothetical protein